MVISSVCIDLMRRVVLSLRRENTPTRPALDGRCTDYKTSAIKAIIEGNIFVNAVKLPLGRQYTFEIFRTLSFVRLLMDNYTGCGKHWMMDLL